MKIWKWSEVKNKIEVDLDLEDETFITTDEFSGYCNEALIDASAEIYDLCEDYFQTKYYIPGVQGQKQFPLPSNINSNKIRKVIYANGSIVYECYRYHGLGKFIEPYFTDLYGAADDYRYFLPNDIPGQAMIEFHPALRESTILPPQSNSFTPLTMFYLRDVARVPMTNGNTGASQNGSVVGEFCNPEIVAPSQINTGTSQITTYSGTTTYGIKAQGQVGCYPGSIAYVTGDCVQVSAAPGDVLPTPLTANTNYFVVALGNGVIQLATTYANATASVPVTIALTGNCTIFMEIKVAATPNIVNAVLIDIPTFAQYVIQYVKVCCLPKEGDPRMSIEVEKLKDYKMQMVSSLKSAIPDDYSEIDQDLSHYREMS
jgi:hypothetical protein